MLQQVFSQKNMVLEGKITDEIGSTKGIDYFFDIFL